MSPLRLIVLIACVWTAYTVFQRAEMLRKRLDPRPDIPRSTYQGNWPMILGMDLVALAFAGWAIEIYLTPGDPDWGPAAVALTASVASTILLVSMIGHNMREQARRKARETEDRGVSDMTAAVEAVVPPVVERSLEKVTGGFREPAPDYDRLIRVEPLPPTQ